MREPVSKYLPSKTVKNYTFEKRSGMEGRRVEHGIAALAGQHDTHPRDNAFSSIFEAAVTGSERGAIVHRRIVSLLTDS